MVASLSGLRSVSAGPARNFQGGAFGSAATGAAGEPGMLESTEPSCARREGTAKTTRSKAAHARRCGCSIDSASGSIFREEQTQFQPTRSIKEYFGGIRNDVDPIRASGGGPRTARCLTGLPLRQTHPAVLRTVLKVAGSEERQLTLIWNGGQPVGYPKG